MLKVVNKYCLCWII